MPVQGLLQKANLLQSEGLAFFDFISKHKIKYCAFLKPAPLNYVILNSYGFDAESIISSISTQDFWEGTISETNKVFNFSTDDNSINIILQLLSVELKHTLSEISVIRLSDGTVFLLGNQIIDKAIINDLKILKLDSYKKNKPTLSNYSGNVITKKYTLTISNFVEDYFKNQNITSDLVKIFSDAVYKEIQLRLYFAFNDYSSVFAESLFKYNLTLQETKDLSLTLLKTHIISMLNDVLPVDEDNISLIEA